MSFLNFLKCSPCFCDIFLICVWCRSLYIPGIVHENPRILSDGESEEISGTSSEDYVSPVKLRNRPRRANDVSSVDLSSSESVQKDYSYQIQKF